MFYSVRTTCTIHMALGAEQGQHFQEVERKSLLGVKPRNRPARPHGLVRKPVCVALCLYASCLQLTPTGAAK